MIGLIAEVSVRENSDGTFYAADPTYTPIVTHIQKGFGKITVYPLSDYTEDLASENLIAIQDSGFSLDYCNELLRNVMSADN